MDELRQEVLAETAALYGDKSADGAGSSAGSAPDKPPPEAPETGSESAKNMAKSILTLAEQGVRFLIDRRIGFAEGELDQSVENIAPVIEKHGLAIGDGKIPMAEEVGAGFELGGLVKKVYVAKKELNAMDEKTRKQNRAEHGEERKHRPESGALAVSGNNGVRQEPDTKTDVEDSPGFLG